MADTTHNVVDEVAIISGYTPDSTKVVNDWGPIWWAYVCDQLYDEYPARITRGDVASLTDSTFKLDNLLPKFRASVKSGGSTFVYNCKNIPDVADAFSVVAQSYAYLFDNESDFDAALLMVETLIASDVADDNGDSALQTSLLSDYDDLFDGF